MRARASEIVPRVQDLAGRGRAATRAAPAALKSRIRDRSARVRQGLRGVRAFSPAEVDRRTIWIAAIVAVVLLEAGIILVYQGFGGQSSLATGRSAQNDRQESVGRAAPSEPSPQDRMPEGTTEPTREGDPLSPWGRPVQNTEGGYSFGVPPGWSVERDGTMTEIDSPDGDTVVSLGPGFPGSISAASGRLVDLLDRSYDGVSVAETLHTRINDRRTLIAQGSAVNESGVTIDFRLYTIQSAQTNFAIGAFQRSAAPTWRSGDADDVARSFRVVASD